MKAQMKKKSDALIIFGKDFVSMISSIKITHLVKVHHVDPPPSVCSQRRQTVIFRK